ncbi:nicotinate-nucleotide adenylyltransferase [Sodalis sp. CWE]|uniref:nicotinate-nucleotide adenylyltransferase n=1 Tax=Sodalis sp. CWE TaxID=2803816 RepID=UPI001C7D3422|nr:nicotinate-nucleotide adenylyltransferase [Sodalis sp. CWE]MBX4180928.1 nicotinate-nucleotide adenylyltransferase [Sodalis sp. CWE]
MSEKHGLIAFYGGTFDPIHYGHLRLVISLAKFIHFQRVVFLPNNIPTHRPIPVASAQQRLAMARLAISELSNRSFDVDARELRYSTPSYTINTFEAIRKEYGPSAPLAFIIGQDSLLTLPRWYRGLELPIFCHLLMCARPGYSNWSDIRRYSFWFANRLTHDPQALYKKPAGLVYCATTMQLAISASNIRSRYRNGLACDGLLPSSVQGYIDQQGLYR